MQRKIDGLSQSKAMNHLSRHEKLILFRKTLDRLIEKLGFRTGHEYNAIAKILEERSIYLRFQADELLSGRAEVPTKL